MSESDRAAALMRQRMARQNQQLHMANPPPPQRAGHRPPNAPSMPMQRPGPPPPGTPRTTGQITGSGRQIQPKRDPAGRYSNIKESNTAEEGDTREANMLLGVNQLVVGVVTALAFSAVFVLPRQLKVFWVVIMGLTILVTLGLILFTELVQYSKKEGEGSKYAEWAWVLLFGLLSMFVGVFTGVLIFMAWSLYSIANSKTNIARNDRAAMRGKVGNRENEEVYV